VSRKYFGTDGIRDVAGQGLLAAPRIRELGWALGAYLHQRQPAARVLVGRDTRASGPSILEGLAPGITGAGHRLLDGGILSTPAVQSLCREEAFDLAIVISASHNPARDNGIKLFGSDGRKLPDDAELLIEELMDEAAAGRVPPRGPKGSVERDDAAGQRYLRFLREDCLPDLDLSGMRVVLDCAHGAASELGPELLESFGAQVDTRGAAPDGLNINDGAGVFFVEELGEGVQARGAVLGMALDGDADRVLVVDETGIPRDGDHVMGILAADLKERGALHGDRLVTTVMANLGLRVYLKSLDIACDMVPVGDRFVASRMAETGAVLGGEQSGHVIFRSGDRWFGDGLYTALRLLDVIGRCGRPLSELAARVEKFPQVLVNVPVQRKTPIEQLEELRATAERCEAELGGEGRVLLRYSGTEPLLRVMVEGRDAARIEDLAQQMVDVVRRLLGS
jgi:phosphoglucosamine mutase